jgi:hypothetical protein
MREGIFVLSREGEEGNSDRFGEGLGLDLKWRRFAVWSWGAWV